MKHGSLSRHHSYIAANTSIFRTISYALPASSLPIADCRNLETMLYSDLMPKMGLSHKLPLPYRYGTLAYQGMGELYEYICVYVDDLIVVSKKLLKIIDELKTIGKYTFKGAGGAE